MLATMVGSANGRSISALTKAFPRKSSRTNTQATSVPSTTLITATMSDTTTVMRSAARAFGAVTAFQKVTGPSSSDFEHDGGQRQKHDDAEPEGRDPQTDRTDAPGALGEFTDRLRCGRRLRWREDRRAGS